MRPFTELSSAGQVRRLRPLAAEALGRFGLGGADLRLVQNGDNTVFRADIGASGSDPFVPGRYAVRVHGLRAQSHEAIASEAAWLRGLRESGLEVPHPVATRAGGLVTDVTAEGVDGSRSVTVLRWLRGRIMGDRPPTSRFAAVGTLVATLHDHASTWTRPSGFTRLSWDWDGMFGDSIGFGGVPGSKVWSLVPEPHLSRWRSVADRVGELAAELGVDEDAYGLIHADLHMDNMLFDRGRVYPIDFDDCGWGWFAYDIAVVLSEGLRLTERWEDVWRQFSSGYEAVRPLPPGIGLLDDLLAARWVMIGMWVIGMAESNPRFADMVSDELRYVTQDLDALGR